MKYISKEEREELEDLFFEAVTGSGGTIESGVNAILSKLGVEIYPEKEVGVVMDVAIEHGICTRRGCK